MLDPSHSFKRRPWDPITLAQMQRIKRWREAHHASHPMERRTWEAVLTLWMMGWIGWLPAFEVEAWWAFPLCLLGILAPSLYVYFRTQAHASQRLRCDWLDVLD